MSPPGLIRVHSFGAVFADELEHEPPGLGIVGGGRCRPERPRAVSAEVFLARRALDSQAVRRALDWVIFVPEFGDAVQQWSVFAVGQRGSALIKYGRGSASGQRTVTVSCRYRRAKSEQAMLLVPQIPRYDCLFCEVYAADDQELPWYDRPLIRQDTVGVAVCAVGAFVPGYVLISPAQHESSVQALAAEAAPGFLTFVDRVVEAVERKYGPSTLFEHGSCRAEERRRSACITHSHIHVVPGAYSFNLLGLPVRPLETLADLVNVPAAERADGYLMYREPGGLVQYSPDAGISQYFRRHIARMLGCPDDWDYAVFPQWENVRATQDSFPSSPVRPLPLTEPA